jgi:phosphoenolpyruvate---glycerone phosphotransferase subunit DhaL
MAAELATLGARAGRPVLDALIGTIHEHAAHLGALDGATGDGDHGVNMNKGFTRAGQLLGPSDESLAGILSVLGQTLLTEVGGAMGPLYGSFFLDMAAAAGAEPTVTADTFGQMLTAGVVAVIDIGEANVGDKTLLDALVPAESAYRAAKEAGGSFAEALAAMADAAETGAESTRDMVALVGRASRLGERSRGHLDAGAASCALILRALASSVTSQLDVSPVTPAAGTERAK